MPEQRTRIPQRQAPPAFDSNVYPDRAEIAEKSARAGRSDADTLVSRAGFLPGLGGAHLLRIAPFTGALAALSRASSAGSSAISFDSVQTHRGLRSIQRGSVRSSQAVARPRERRSIHKGECIMSIWARIAALVAAAVTLSGVTAKAG